MAELPKRLLIGYQTVPIIRTPKPDGKSSNIGAYTNGYHNPTGPMIEIQPYLSGVELVNVLVHETLHGIAHSYGPPGFVEDLSVEEPVINQLANGLVQVFRDNPELLSWITKELGRDRQLQD